MVVNTVEIRSRIQAEINNHLAMAASLQEKLTLLGQIESLANEVSLQTGDRSQKTAVVPDAKPEASNAAIPLAEQAIQEVPQAAKEGAGNGAKNPWAYMQQG